MTVQSSIDIAARAMPGGRKVEARLSYGQSGGKTYLAHQFTPYPFHITRPFHIPGDPGGMATLYLQSCSGGLYGDDDLRLSVELAPDAHVHLTTQASTVVHAARGGVSRVHTDLKVGPGSVLEYCPDPAILLPGARLHSSVTARSAPGASLIVTDAFLAHDPAAEGRPFGDLLSDVRLEDASGTPLLIDRQAVTGEDWPARVSGYGCFGTFMVAPVSGLTDLAQVLRETLANQPEIYGGLSQFADRGVLLARFVATDGVALTSAFAALWSAARRGQFGIDPTRRKK